MTPGKDVARKSTPLAMMTEMWTWMLTRTVIDLPYAKTRYQPPHFIFLFQIRGDAAMIGGTG